MRLLKWTGIVLLAILMLGCSVAPETVGVGDDTLQRAKPVNDEPTDPVSASLTVVISEIGWAGTDISAYDEWIELYNNTAQPVDISGWKIVGKKFEIVIPQGKTIAANGYFLLERTDDDSVPGKTADTIFTGALDDAGMDLTLQDGSGAALDTISMSRSGWAAGSASPKISMQRIDTTKAADSSNWKDGAGDIEGAQNSGTAASSSSSVASSSSSVASSSSSVASSSSSVASSSSSVASSSSSVASSSSSVASSSAAPGGPSVVISEIAWAGTDVSYYDEWIELYNNTDQPIDLNGWSLSGDFTVALSGTIPAKGYFLLERGDDNTVPGKTADLIYTGTLNNTGGTLSILDNTGKQVDLVSMPSGWIAGSNSPKISMVRIDTTKIDDSAANWQNGIGDVEGAQNSGDSGTASSSASSVSSSTAVSSSSVPVDQNTEKIKIGSFNIQIFGTTKISRSNTLNVLAMIATNFDILAVQEVGSNSTPSEDTATTVMDTYIAKINEHAGAGVYAYIRGHQYAYVYRTDRVRLNGWQLYSGSASFAYTPLLAYFSTISGNFDFAMINIHTSPTIATSEIPALKQVISETATLYNEADVICTGDYNADGSYYDEGSSTQTWLNGFDSSSYITGIPNWADTTVSPNNDYTYDRMQMTTALSTDYTGTWGVFPMGTVYDVSQCEGTDLTAGTENALSDHYPVWTEFYTSRDTD